MSPSLQELIERPELRPLVALHATKVALAIGGMIFLLIALIASLAGASGEVWYVPLGLMGGATICALVANRWSEALFVRRAGAAGVDRHEARDFIRTYDWDDANA